MPVFFCKLNAPRPTFAIDMNPQEARLMQDHAAHWHRWKASGHVKAFGVVADPAGAFGIGIVDFEDAAAVRAFTDADPVIQANRGFSYDVLPMPMGVVV